jgi:hypothetical protein
MRNGDLSLRISQRDVGVRANGDRAFARIVDETPEFKEAPQFKGAPKFDNFEDEERLMGELLSKLQRDSESATNELLQKYGPSVARRLKQRAIDYIHDPGIRSVFGAYEAVQDALDDAGTALGVKARRHSESLSCTAGKTLLPSCIGPLSVRRGGKSSDFAFRTYVSVLTCTLTSIPSSSSASPQ